VKVLKRLGWLLTLMCIAVWLITPASAQTELRAIIGSLDLSEFPRVITYLDVRGSQGFFVPGLPSDTVVIYEDEQPLVGTLTEVRAGSQVVFAYGGGESFNIRTLDGAISRYELIRDYLLNWAVADTETGVDDLSLVVPDGVLISHEQDGQIWADALQAYGTSTAGATTSLEVLSAAIDIALDPIPREGMGRAVVFLSDSIAEPQLDVFQNLIGRAEQGGVRVHIGLVASPAVFELDMAQVMQAGAQQTGGQFFTFSSNEPLPDMNMMLESSRRAYFLEYRSRANTPGVHTVYVTVNTELGEARSQTVSFESSLAPPSPIFVAPPTQVVRAIPPGEDRELINLAPKEVQLEVLVEFPDSIQRELAYSALYVNGEKAVENLQPPYEMFTLDLTPYQISEILVLSAEVIDELGITGNTVDVSLEIVVQQPSVGLFSSLGRNAGLIAGGVVLLSGSVLLLVLVLAGRLRPRQLGERRRKRTAERDPVTQPIDLDDEIVTSDSQRTITRLARGFPNRLPWRQRSRTTPYAYLVRVDEDGKLIAETEFPMTSAELTFGSDPTAAVLTINDPAVESLHARVWRDETGNFWVADMGSVAGTWVNYAPVSTSGSQLEHGDLIHVSKKGFRFTLSRPTRPRRTVVTPLVDENENSEEDK
jgi:hypothetical protein